MTKAGGNLSALIFGAGLLMIGADLILFLMDWHHAGIAFCVGLVVCALSALASEKSKTEDVIILLVGSSLLAWVVISSI